MIADEQSAVAHDPAPGPARPDHPGEPDTTTRTPVWTAPQRDRFTVAGVDLEYEVGGTGDTVVLIHAGVCAEWFAPLLREPALVQGHRVRS